MKRRGAGRPQWSLSPTSLSVSYGGRSTINGAAADWFGPQQPMAPAAPPSVEGRRFDFPQGANLQIQPRAYEPVKFEDLRALADGWDLLRIVIETRKDQVERMNWTVKPKKDKTGPGDSRIAQIVTFLESPDGIHDWAEWLRPILEDLFVLDAPALWVQKTRGGATFALHHIDGAKIKRVIDEWGRTPGPVPNQAGGVTYPCAYQFVAKGMDAVNYSVQDLIYRPRNMRTNKIYGYGPVEQIIATVNIALKRQLFQLSYYSEGNIPEAMIGVPDNWTPDQIRNFQDYWDDYFTGDAATRRRAKFVPGGVAKTFIQTKEPEMKNVFDDWLARVCCAAFSINPQPFIQQSNRATANTAKEQAEEEGLFPILNWIKRLCDHIIQIRFGELDLEFSWQEDEQIDQAQEQITLTGYVGAGILSRNRARARLGEEKDPDPNADKLMVTTGTGPVPLDAYEQQQAAAAKQAEALANRPVPIIAGPGGGVPQNGGPKPGNAKTANQAKAKAAKGPNPINAAADDVGKAFDPDQPRDDHGRWGGGTAIITTGDSGEAKELPTKEDEATAFRKGLKKVGVAVGLIAGATLAVALAPEAATVVAIAALAEHAATGMLLSAAATSLDIVGGQLGLPAHLVEGIMHHLENVEKADAAGSDVSAYAVAMAKRFLPKFAEVACDALANHLDDNASDADAAKRKACDDGIEKAKAAFLARVKALTAEAIEKLDFAPAGTFTKGGARQLAAIPFDRPAVATAVEAISEKLKLAFAKIGRKVTAELRTHLAGAEKLAKADDDDDRDRNDQIAARLADEADLSSLEDLAESLGVDLSALASDTAALALGQVGPAAKSGLVDQVNAKAVVWAQDRAAELVGMRVLDDGSIIQNPRAEYAITDSTREMLRQTIASGLNDNIGVEEIIANIEALAFSPERADLIGRTEVASANSEAALIGYRGARDGMDISVKKSWLLGEHPCKACQENADAGAIDLDDDFPSGDAATPAHPRCECATAPVVSEEDQ